MTAKVFSLAARPLAAILFAGVLWAAPPALAQNAVTQATQGGTAQTPQSGAASPPAATIGGTKGTQTDNRAPSAGPKTGTAEHPAANSAGWGADDVGLAIAFAVIILIAIFFYRRTSEPPRKPPRR